MGLKTTYASGKRDNNKVSINNNISLKFFLRLISNIRFNNNDFTIKPNKFLIILANSIRLERYNFQSFHLQDLVSEFLMNYHFLF